MPTIGVSLDPRISPQSLNYQPTPLSPLVGAAKWQSAANEERGFAGVRGASYATSGYAEAWQAEVGLLSRRGSANPKDEIERQLCHAAARVRLCELPPRSRRVAYVPSRPLRLFSPCPPNFLRPLAKTCSFHGQKYSNPWPKEVSPGALSRCLVIYTEFLSQLYYVVN